MPNRFRQDYAERFRPRTWDEVTGQDNAVTTLRATLQHGHIARAYLLEGPMGTGKTTLARVYSHALTCLNRADGDDKACGSCASCGVAITDHPDIRVIDSTNLGGVNDIREHILGSAYYQPILGKYRVYIIDEAHGLTGASANALLNMIEYPPERTVFFFCTTQAGRMTDTLKDRCWRIHLEPGSDENILAVLMKAVAAANLDVDPAVVNILAQRSGGSYRQGLILLNQAVETFGKSLDTENLNKFFLNPPVEVIQNWYQMIRARDWDKTLNLVQQLNNYSPEHCLRMILEVYELGVRPSLETVREYNALADAVMLSLKKLRSGIQPYTVLLLLSMELMTDGSGLEPSINSCTGELNDH